MDVDTPSPSQHQTKTAENKNQHTSAIRPCEAPLKFAIGPNGCKVIVYGQEFRGVDAERPGDKLRRAREQAKAAGLMDKKEKAFPEG
jgi:hypothetical protein